MPSETMIHVDATAINGLRGIAALQVLLSHSLKASFFGFNTYAQVCF